MMKRRETMNPKKRNQIVNDIIELSDNLLRFKPIFEYYDKHLSENQELFDAIVHSNEFEQLKNNAYYKQTTDDLKTNYEENFRKIHQSVKKLNHSNHNPSVIRQLKENVSELDFSKKYLEQNIFKLKAVRYQLSKISHCKKITKEDFIQVRKKLDHKLNIYISKYPI